MSHLQISNKLSRASFLKSIATIGLFSQVPLIFNSCKNENILSFHKELPKSDYLTDDELLIIREIQNILFPEDDNGPAAYQVNAELFFARLFEDKRRDPDENEYLKNGLTYIDESSVKIYKKKFLKLNKENKEKLIGYVAKTDWGKSWLSVNLTIIFEALLSDPIYDGNIDEIGWKWLNHTAGVPRATKDLKYDEIFKTLEME